MSKISELSDGGVIQGGDTLIAVRSGGNVKVTYGGSTTANIDGGTIDGTVIGGSTAAAGSFTTGQFNTSLNVDGTVTADGLTVDGSANVKSSGGKSTISIGDTAASTYAQLLLYGGATKYNWMAAAQYNANDAFEITPSTAAEGVIFSNPALKIDSNRDISFYEDTGTTPKFFWDASAESLGIGTNLPTSPLHIKSATNVNVRFDDSGSSSYTWYMNDAQNLYIPNVQLASTHTFYANGQRKVDIDSSGNLLVGKTSSDLTTDGFEVRPTGFVGVRSNGDPLYLNRKSSDGAIATFVKDGAPVGSIGVDSGDNLYIGGSAASHSGLYFGTNTAAPITAGTLTDAVTDLGTAGYRFKDLHLSGGVVFGTTGGSVSSKTLDDYEEGTWTPVISTTTPPTTPFTQYNDGASYTKIGNVVFLYAMFRTNGVTIAGAAGDVIIAGLPFTPSSTVSGGGLTALQTGGWVTGPRAGYTRTTNDILLTYTPTATGEVSSLPYTALTTGAGINNLIQIMAVYRTDS